MTKTLRNEIINAVSYHRNAVPSYQLMWEGVDEALANSFHSLAALDEQISKIDPDVDSGLYEELVFCRNELEEKLTAN